MLLEQEMSIEGSDFTHAGLVSTDVKALLKKIGLDPKLIRRVAIAAYEAEMNVIIHARRARVKFNVTPTMVELMFLDEGKGIADVEQAMQEGYSTATDEVRSMGFGSGMGLPNIKRNADKLDVRSVVGQGTTVHMQFFV
ncbi:anti-sigma regulatory factor [candidate division GN15 bacterium]|nr:anti-sigma regulatory factor [candidate division GN15 bacterium]